MHFNIGKIPIRKPGSSSVLLICYLFNSLHSLYNKSVVVCLLPSTRHSRRDVKGVSKKGNPTLECHYALTTG